MPDRTGSKSFTPAHLIPGHGPLMTSDEIEPVFERLRRYYQFVLDTADDGLAHNRSPLQAARACDLGEFADWPDSERLVLNLHRAYAERRARSLTWSPR